MEADWRSLVPQLHRALNRLEDRSAGLLEAQALLLVVEPEPGLIGLHWCGPDGSVLPAELPAEVLAIPPLPAITDVPRDHLPGESDDPPNGSIDRAISKLGADMLSWSSNPETFELEEHCRYQLFLRWPGRDAKPVYPFAYGLWDE